MFTERIEKAIKFACVLHRSQVRKSDGSPYVFHLFSVALIVLNYTKDENTIIAALLHDTIEDTDYTFEQLKDDFGEEVENIVRTVSENKTENGEKVPWQARKEQYLGALRKGSKEALFVSAADKIHNMQCMISEYKRRGEEMWGIFTGAKKEQLWFYEKIYDILEEKLPQYEALLAEYKSKYVLLRRVSEIHINE